MNLEENIVKMEEQVDKLKCEIASMKVKLKEQDKLELKGGKGYTLKASIIDGSFTKRDRTSNAVARGAFRATKELAEIADKNMVTRNRLEAYVHQIQGDGEGMHYIYKSKNEYKYSNLSSIDILGTVMMKKETAELLCEKLNASEIEL